MGTKGVFGVHRGIWDHPTLAGDDPFSRREAWLWLISEAAWKARRVRRGSILLDLVRGQIGHALRFIAKEWRWSEPRVRRFLAQLKTDAAIDASTDRGITVITICNYDRYQVVGMSEEATGDAANDAPATQPRRKLEEGKKEDIDRGVRARATPAIPPEAIALSDRFLVAIRVDPQNPELDGMSGAPYEAAMWISKGFDHDLLLATAANTAAQHDYARLPISYYSKAIKSAHDRRDRERQRQLPLLQTVGGTDVVAASRPDRGRSRPNNSDVIVAGMAAALRSCRESRLGNNVQRTTEANGDPGEPSAVSRAANGD